MTTSKSYLYKALSHIIRPKKKPIFCGDIVSLRFLAGKQDPTAETKTFHHTHKYGERKWKIDLPTKEFHALFLGTNLMLSDRSRTLYAFHSYFGSFNIGLPTLLLWDMNLVVSNQDMLYEHRELQRVITFLAPRESIPVHVDMSRYLHNLVNHYYIPGELYDINHEAYMARTNEVKSFKQFVDENRNKFV